MSIVAALLAGLAIQSADPAEVDAAQAWTAFEALKGLEGRWRDTLDTERPMTIDYRVISGGQALVESWTTPSGRESLTVYVMDGDRLIATHYCPQGVHPTLALVEAGQTLRFDYVSAANMTSPAATHQHAFSITPGLDRMPRTETYRAGDESETTRYDMARVR